MRPGPATSSPRCCPSASGSLGPEHPDTLAARNQPRLLDRGGGGCGRGPGPVRRAAARPRAGLGPEHPDTLATRSHLARWTGEAGDAAGARDQFAALLPVRERVLGPEHPDTLATRARPRLVDRGGRGCGRRPGPVRRAAAGHASGCWAPSTPHTLTTRDNLARWTGEAGDAAGARDQFAALLPIRERVLGPEHPATLALSFHRGLVTGRRGLT